MKKIALLAASTALSALIAAPSFAATPAGPESGTQTSVAIGGTVAKMCGTGTQSGGGVRTEPAVVELGNIVDGNGQLTAAVQAQTTIGFNNFWCNHAGTVSITASRFDSGQPTPADASSFFSYMDMIVEDAPNNNMLAAYFGGATLNTATVAGSTANGAPTGAFESGTGRYARTTVRMVLPSLPGIQAGDRPVAGTYRGVVTVTVAPSA